MSVDYNANIVVGFSLDKESVLKQFEHGNMVGNRIKRWTWCYELDGKMYGDEDLIEALREKVKPEVIVEYGDYDGQIYLAFCLDLEEDATGLQSGHVGFGGNLDLDEVLRQAPKLKLLKKKLVSLGLKPEKPKIIMAWTVS
jgi:hypothetical protein